MRRILLAAVAVATAVTMAMPAARATQIGAPRPFRIEGTVARVVVSGVVGSTRTVEVVLSPVTDGTPGALRRSEASGSFRIDVSGAAKQNSQGGSSDRYYCGDQVGQVTHDICAVGTQVEVLGRVERGVFNNDYIAEIVRPVSGFGDSERLAVTVVPDPLIDSCGECIGGEVLIGPLAGYQARLWPDCNAFGHETTWQLSKGIDSFSGTAYDTTQGGPLDYNGPEPGMGGAIVSGTGKFASTFGAARASGVCQDSVLDGEPLVEFQLEFAEPSPL